MDYTAEETRVGQTADDLPTFDNTKVFGWSDADELTHRWANLSEGELEAAVGRLPLEQLRSLFVFGEGIMRTHRDRAEEAGVLVDRLRGIVRRSASFGQDEETKQAGY